MRRAETSEKSRVVESVRSFVADLLSDSTFDFIIPIERKGTALVRAALLAQDEPSWERVLSREAACQRLRDARDLHVLILDDSVWSGRALRETLKQIRDTNSSLRTTTAAFLSHEESRSECLDIVYFRGLDDEIFARYRNYIVEYLQQQGSLLLDTEHVEVEIALECSPDEFYNALAGWGRAVRFAPTSQRTTCTVFLEAENFEEQLRDVVPSSAQLAGAVSKIRVVSRPHGYSLIPICYPTLSFDRHSTFEHPRMKWTRGVEGSRLFNCVGLGAAIRLGNSAMQWLHDALRGRIEFRYGQASLGHLKAIFPEISLEEVEAELNQWRAVKRPRKPQSGSPEDPGLDRLEEIAEFILWHMCDSISYESGNVRDLTLDDILQLERVCGPPWHLSAALDLLIDRAWILPKVDVRKQGDRNVARRTFGPDGEMIRREIIRRALLAGRGIEIESVV